MDRSTGYARQTFTALVLLAALSTSPQLVVAQAGDLFSNVPYEPGFIAEKIQEHTINNAQGQSSNVPDNVYYQIIFRELIADPKLNASLPESDWNIIENIPSHRDAQFASVNFANLEKICQLHASGKGANARNARNTNIIDVSARFDADRKRSESVLDRHYSRVLTRLTNATQSYIEKRRSELAESEQIGYAAFDLAGFATEVPEAAEVLMDRGCQRNAIQQAAYAPRSLKMSEEQPLALPFTKSK